MVRIALTSTPQFYKTEESHQNQSWTSSPSPTKRLARGWQMARRMRSQTWMLSARSGTSPVISRWTDPAEFIPRDMTMEDNAKLVKHCFMLCWGKKSGPFAARQAFLKLSSIPSPKPNYFLRNCVTRLPGIKPRRTQEEGPRFPLLCRNLVSSSP